MAAALFDGIEEDADDVGITDDVNNADETNRNAETVHTGSEGGSSRSRVSGSGSGGESSLLERLRKDLSPGNGQR